MRPDDGAMPDDEATAAVFGPDGHLDESAAHAFIDGALGDEDAARVVLHLAGCGACAAVVAEARGLAAAAAGIVRRLDDGPGAVAVLPARPVGLVAGAPVRLSIPRRGSRAALRAAAAALVAVGIGGGAYAVARRAPERTVAVAAAPGAAAPVAAAPIAAPTGAPVEETPLMAALPAPPRAVAPTEPRALAARGKRVAEAPSPVAAAPSDAEPGVVVGEVRDAGSRPVPGATVAVAGTSVSATSNDSGQFVLRNVPAGTATLQARRLGYAAQRETLTIGSRDTARVALQLEARTLNLDAVTVTGASAADSDAARKGAVASGAGGVVRADMRRRRTGMNEAASPAGCYVVARDRAADSAPLPRPARPNANPLPYPLPLQLGADGRVRAAGVVRGAWAFDGAGMLRVTWDVVAMPPLVLQRDAAGWTGSGVRLTPARPGACTTP